MTTATLIKENISLGLAYSSEVQSFIIMVGNMAACRQTWCQRGSLSCPTWPASKMQPPVLLKAVYSGSFFLQIPHLSSYKCFSPLQLQPHPHQSPQVTSPHQAGLLSQSEIKGGPSTKHGLVHYLKQTSILLTRKSRMAPYTSLRFLQTYQVQISKMLPYKIMGFILSAAIYPS
jgi:hypothetical protein